MEFGYKSRADHTLRDAEKGGIITPLCMCMYLKERSSLWKWHMGQKVQINTSLLGVGGVGALTKADESGCESETTLIWAIFWFELLLKYEELNFSFQNQTKAMPIPFFGQRKAIQFPKIFLNNCARLGEERIGYHMPQVAY